MRRARLVVLLLSGCLAGCEDALDQRLAIITEPRVLAVIAEPAEAKPGKQVTYRAVLASPGGELAEQPTWAYCLAPKPPTEDNAVSAGCLDDAMTAPLGTAETVTATLPSDGCLLFGPDTPPGGFRPRDPDPSGGYYQPVRVDAVDTRAFGLSRITCKLPTAPADVARQYDLEYTANQNPVLDPIELADVAADRPVTLTASWSPDSVESYLWYDAFHQELALRREAMRVSWYATGGRIDVDASAVGEDETSTQVSTTWHTPAAGPATLWFVLRDSRGGISVQKIDVDVR